MKRKQLVLTAGIILALEGAFLVSCGPPASHDAATSQSTEQTPPETPPPAQEQAPAIAQNPAPEPAPVPSSAPRRAPARQSQQISEVAPQPAPAPVPPPPPQPIVRTVPAGTTLDLVFLDGLSSQTSQAGDTFRARVARDVTRDGLVLIPAGSVVGGSVAEAVALKKIGGTAKLVLAFSSIELTSGTSVGIEATLAEQGKSETKKDAATIGGAAAGGALLGKLVGHDSKGALIGAVVGGAAGTAVAAKTKGEQVEIPVGTERTVELSRSVDVTVRP